MSVELALVQRIEKARACFTANPSFSVLFVCTDGQSFKHEADASAHAYDISRDKSNYFSFLRTSLTIIDAIIAATSDAEINTALGSTTDATLIAYGNSYRGPLTEAERVNNKLVVIDNIEYVETEEIRARLNVLLYREENQSVINAINDAISHLE